MRILLKDNRLRLRDLGIVGTRHAVSEGLVFPFPRRYAVWRLHARRYSKGSCYCREYGDEDVEDFTPGGVVVECSHSGNFELGVSN